jgi:hypothetical protein
MAEKAEAGVNEILKAHPTGDIVAARDNVLLQTLKAKSQTRGYRTELGSHLQMKRSRAELYHSTSSLDCQGASDF